MTAIIYDHAAWTAARQWRALSRRAPRQAIRRIILLREGSDGRWAAAVCEWRFGKWLPPEWLCGASTYDVARSAALANWKVTKLPLCFQHHGWTGLSGFMPGLREPQIGGAA